LTKPLKDLDLLELVGTVLESARRPGTTYRLERVIGRGAQGFVFLAPQRVADSQLTVVVKVLSPSAVRGLPGLAVTAIGKEVEALRRLSEQVPPVPFVVQFIDTGTLRIREHLIELPWIAVEYVDGGLDGTTLRSRVVSSLERARPSHRSTIILSSPANSLALCMEWSGIAV